MSHENDGIVICMALLVSLPLSRRMLKCAPTHINRSIDIKVKYIIYLKTHPFKQQFLSVSSVGRARDC